MPKKANKIEVVDKPKIKQEPKVYFNKYIKTYTVTNDYELSFLKGNFKANELHTIKEWDVLIHNALNRKLV